MKDINISKLKNLNVILLCGLYGSGKTKFANMYFKGTGRSRISRTEIRKLIFEMVNFGEPWTPDKFTDEDDFLIKHVERKITEQFLHDKKSVLLVNTFMSKNSRLKFIRMSKDMNKTIGAVFLDIPLEKCRANNEHGTVRVPEIVLNSLHSKKELPSPEEGFNEVLILKNF